MHAICLLQTPQRQCASRSPFFIREFPISKIELNICGGFIKRHIQIAVRGKLLEIPAAIIGGNRTSPLEQSSTRPPTDLVLTRIAAAFRFAVGGPGSRFLRRFSSCPLAMILIHRMIGMSLNLMLTHSAAITRRNLARSVAGSAHAGSARSECELAILRVMVWIEFAFMALQPFARGHLFAGAKIVFVRGGMQCCSPACRRVLLSVRT